MEGFRNVKKFEIFHFEYLDNVYIVVNQRQRNDGNMIIPALSSIKMVNSSSFKLISSKLYSFEISKFKSFESKIETSRGKLFDEFTHCLIRRENKNSIIQVQYMTDTQIVELLEHGREF